MAEISTSLELYATNRIIKYMYDDLITAISKKTILSVYPPRKKNYHIHLYIVFTMFNVSPTLVLFCDDASQMCSKNI